MGEEKNPEEEKSKKVDEAPVVVVAAPPPPPPEGVEMRMFLHCEGCARKVRKSLKGFNGVEEVKTDCRTHTVVVKGKGAAEDPMKVVERVQAKTGRKVELVSLLPPPKAQKKKDEKKEEPVEIVVLMKIYMHCEACVQEIKKRILRITGVESVETDLNASLATVKGVFDPPKLVEYVHKKTGKRAAIISVEPVEKKRNEKKPKEEEKEKDEEKKDCEKVKEEDNANEEEKKDDDTKDEEQEKEEKKDGDEVEEEMEKDDEKEDDEAEEEKADKEDFDNENEDEEEKELSPEEMEVVAAKTEQKRNEFFYYYPVAYHAYFQHNQHLVYAPQPQVVYPPQIFSDENPNACSIM